MKAFIRDEYSAIHVAELFRVFGDPSRVRILSAVIEQEMNISALAATIGVIQSAVSHHVRELRQLQPVKSRRDGKEVYYHMDDSHSIALLQ